jgi:hypothetical protein
MCLRSAMSNSEVALRGATHAAGEMNVLVEGAGIA